MKRACIRKQKGCNSCLPDEKNVLEWRIQSDPSYYCTILLATFRNSASNKYYRLAVTSYGCSNEIKCGLTTKCK